MTLNELFDTLAKFTPAERDQSLQDLGHLYVEERRRLKDLKGQIEKLDKSKDAAKITKLQETGKTSSQKILMLENVLQSSFKEVALAETATSLLAGTTAATSAQKAEIATALKPDIKTDLSGSPLPFVSVLSGETKTYEEKLRDYLPGMIDAYYSDMVVGRGRAEHGDKTKIHELSEFEAIGKVSKKETDDVFGSFETGTHPEIKADRPTKRGNIHDLWADTEKDLNDPRKKRAAASHGSEVDVLFLPIRRRRAQVERETQC